MTVYYTSNDGTIGFDATTGGTLPTDWAAKVGTWQAGTVNLVNSHTHTFGSTTHADGDAALLTGITAEADMDVVFNQDITAAAGGAQPAIGAMVRSDSANANCYTVIVNATGVAGHFQARIYKKVSGSYSVIAGPTAVAATFTAGHMGTLRVQATGTTIRAKFWDATAASEPAGWDISVTDSSVTAAGYAGLYYALDAGSAVAMGVADFTVSSIPAVISVAPNSASLLYSPGNWFANSSNAITICAGAYFSILFTGTTCTLNFDASNLASPTSQIWWRIDGSQGTWTAAAIATSVICTVPTSTSGNADIAYHLLEVMVKSTTETANRWNSVGSATGTAVIFQGITLAGGAAVKLPTAARKTIMVFGDSITEGVRTVGESATNDTDRNDAMCGWAYRLGALLGAEVGVVGFGALGVSQGGSGNVPAIGTSYALQYSGKSRTWPTLNAIVVHIGTNDGSSNITAAMTTFLNGLIAANVGVPIMVLRPFNASTQAAHLQAAIAACSTPGACHYVDTTGFFDTTYGGDSLNLHPAGPNNLALIAPAIAAVVAPILYPAGGGGGGGSSFGFGL